MSVLCIVKKTPSINLTKCSVFVWKCKPAKRGCHVWNEPRRLVWRVCVYAWWSAITSRYSFVLMLPARAPRAAHEHSTIARDPEANHRRRRWVRKSSRWCFRGWWNSVEARSAPLRECPNRVNAKRIISTKGGVSASSGSKLKCISFKMARVQVMKCTRVSARTYAHTHKQTKRFTRTQNNSNLLHFSKHDKMRATAYTEHTPTTSTRVPKHAHTSKKTAIGDLHKRFDQAAAGSSVFPSK